MIQKQTTAETPKLFRVMLRGREYLGTAEEYHAKVVAPDFLTALTRAIEALRLEPAKLGGSAVTVISETTEIVDGKVFDMARRSRGFGERGGWTFRHALPARSHEGPRTTEAL